MPEQCVSVSEPTPSTVALLGGFELHGREVERSGVVEVRENEGRRRRVFTITADGTAALISWLDQPSDAFSELRDLGLMQLFFGDLTTAESRMRMAEHQLAIHRTRLAAYQRDVGAERVADGTRTGYLTIERWRSKTLQMGVLYEGVAVDFWTAVVADARADPGSGDQG